jgi:choline dehydrogenase-like flavoprotein
MPYDFDAIVVGGGAGGGTFAAACARAGKNVLLVDRGFRAGRPAAHDERSTLIDKKPYDDRFVRVNGVPRKLYVGGVLGGGTALYGGALLRPSRDDFQPGRHYGNRLPRETWDWPIDYDDLDPFYAEAEQLYGVAGSVADDFGPLGKPDRGFPKEPLPLAPINNRLIATNRARGLRPFRLPLAIDSTRCQRCAHCAGFVCPTGARTSSDQVVDAEVSTGARLTVISGTEVECLTNGPARRFDTVELRDRSSGQRQTYRARCYIIAAGAIGSPALLFRSGFDGPLIGRNYMYHLSPVVAGVFSTRTGGDATFVKQVGFADYYLGTAHYPHKMGLVQSLPVPGPLMLAKVSPIRLPGIMWRTLRRRLLPMVGIVEDLPNPANRVFLTKGGTTAILHSFSPYDRDRGQELTKLMVGILKAAGAWMTIKSPFPSEEHVAHQCGTLRFGRSAAHAVADKDCRLFGRNNAFVVDGSVLPTSLGVGPALTIMANALRVARVVAAEV